MGNVIFCRSCGASVDRNDLVSRGLEHCTSCGEQLDALLFNDSKLSEVEIPLRPPPPGSRIEIIEADNNRLMLSIPPGGKRSRSLGCFALVWTLISVPIFVGMLAGGMADDDFPLAIALIPGLFVLIGIVMTTIWIRMTYTRGYLFLEPHRAVMQKILFNRKKNTETGLDSSSLAHLITSYEENDVPVYRIELQGVGRSLSFGTAWEREAKDWYVETLNSFLNWHYNKPSNAASKADGEDSSVFSPGRGHVGKKCPACGETTRLVMDDGSSLSTGNCLCERCGSRLIVLAGEITEAFPVQIVSPDVLTEDSPFELANTGVKEWLLTVNTRHSQDSSVGGGCLLVFGAIWESFVSFWTWGATQAPANFKYLALCFSLPFHAVGLGLLTLALYVFFGRFRLKLSRDESWGRWSIGPLRYTRRFRAESVTEVKLVRGSALSSSKNRVKNERASSQSQEFSCILMSAGNTLPVTCGNSSDESRLAAGLVRYCLDDLGIRLQDD